MSLGNRSLKHLRMQCGLSAQGESTTLSSMASWCRSGSRRSWNHTACLAGIYLPGSCETHWDSRSAEKLPTSGLRLASNDLIGYLARRHASALRLMHAVSTIAAASD